jgi:hypothetical protein
MEGLMTESVAELLQRVEEALGEYEQADQTTRTVESLTRADGEIRPYVEDLERMVDAFDVLTRAGRRPERPDTRGMAVALRATANRVRRSKTVPPDHPRTLREIQRIVSTARETAKDSWRESIDARMPGLDGLSGLATVLSQLREDPRKVESLRRAASDLKALSRQLPDETTAGKVTEKITVINEALTSLLGGSREAADVRRFLEMAALGGAPVSALTPAVREWMHRNNTEGSFKIVSGRPAGE